MPKKNLYLLILGFALAGYSWVILNHYLLKTNKPTLNVCLFRQATGIPCPSCGTTHAILSITKGNFRQALDENILGFPAALMLVIFPVWVLIDLIRKKESFYYFYFWAESFLRKKWVAYSALVFLLANWGWNIFKNG
ncbi:MAG: DUF2752 domain-containing protein [Bacteroidetes bacterium]|nr:MAG: DUF2752 domain-containing protein [Bacteroidota bacterium]